MWKNILAHLVTLNGIIFSWHARATFLPWRDFTLQLTFWLSVNPKIKIIYTVLWYELFFCRHQWKYIPAHQVMFGSTFFLACACCISDMMSFYGSIIASTVCQPQIKIDYPVLLVRDKDTKVLLPKLFNRFSNLLYRHICMCHFCFCLHENSYVFKWLFLI